MIKFEKISDFYKEEEKVMTWESKTFIGFDFSSLDLSDIPKEVWYDCTFENCNFKNTNIKFEPRKLKHIEKFRSFGHEFFLTGYKNYTSIKDCNFENCDLSYLSNYDLEKVNITGCNFKNTGLRVDFSYLSNVSNYIYDLYDVILDDFYNDKPSTYWKDIEFNFNTLLLNPQINFGISSKELFQIENYPNEDKTTLEELEFYLTLDKEGYLIALYNTLKNHLTKKERIAFLKDKKLNKDLGNIIIKNIPLELLSLIRFGPKAKLGEVVLTESFDEIIYGNSFGELWKKQQQQPIYRLPNISFDSWQYLNKSDTGRIGRTNFTYRVNLNVELDRDLCNANCRFGCRNKFFEPVPYNHNNIVLNIAKLHSRYRLNNIVVGGGEPTLLLEDIESLCDTAILGPKWFVFTNGSTSWEELSRILFRTQAGLYVSRHALDDDENRKILALKNEAEINLLNLKKLWDLSWYYNPILSATCFKGGLDTPEKIIKYFNGILELGASQSIMLTNLYKDFSAGSKCNFNNLALDSDIFNEVKNYLIRKDYTPNTQIYSTAGFKVTTYRNLTTDSRVNIIFKEHITKKELEEAWPTAIKRTFDLSIDPAGNIYENWHQSYAPFDIDKSPSPPSINKYIFQKR